jgi:hypothetical protein
VAAIGLLLHALFPQAILWGSVLYITTVLLIISIAMSGRRTPERQAHPQLV